MKAWGHIITMWFYIHWTFWKHKSSFTSNHCRLSLDLLISSLLVHNGLLLAAHPCLLPRAYDAGMSMPAKTMLASPWDPLLIRYKLNEYHACKRGHIHTYTHTQTHAFCACHTSTINVIFNLSLWVMPWKNVKAMLKQLLRNWRWWVGWAGVGWGWVDGQRGRLWHRDFTKNLICMCSSRRNLVTNSPTFVHICCPMDCICIKIVWDRQWRNNSLGLSVLPMLVDIGFMLWWKSSRNNNDTLFTTENFTQRATYMSMVLRCGIQTDSNKKVNHWQTSVNTLNFSVYHPCTASLRVGNVEKNLHEISLFTSKVSFGEGVNVKSNSDADKIIGLRSS